MTDNGSRKTPPLAFVQPDDRADTRVLVPTTTAAPSRPPSDVVWSLGGSTMGTTWAARIAAPPGSEQQAFERAIQAELDAIVALFSPWHANSEINRFNAAPAGTWELSEAFWALLTQSMDIADDTDGAFDPTLGAMADLWGFGPAGPRPANALLSEFILPSDVEVDTALTTSGWQKLRLNRAARAAVQPGGMRLDLSGLLIGFALDRVSEKLSRLGATSHLIEIGGKMRGAGVKADAQPWWVEIGQPVDGPSPPTVAALLDIAVVTSSEDRGAFRVKDRLYSQTFDGRSGHPVENELISVTVFHASAMQADAFATALAVMGPYDGPEFAEAFGLAAHFVERTPRGSIERMTPAFAAMMAEGAEEA